jgi:hypothetical protein
MAEAIATQPLLPARVAQPTVPLARLASCVRTLDPGARALLDLSLRRGLRDEAIAAIVRQDPFRLAWGRARAIERVAQEMGATGPAALRAIRAALPSLPDDAWGVPALEPPKPSPTSVELVERPAEAPVIYDARPVRTIAVPRKAMRSAALAAAGAALGLMLGRRRRTRN